MTSKNDDGSDKAAVSPVPPKAPPAKEGHNFPFEERGMSDDDRSSHVVVSFLLPTCLYLDSASADGRTIVSGSTSLDFAHIVNPNGRCGMPVQMSGAEIIDDDRGNYSYTSVSACIKFDSGWKGRDYVLEALRAVNDVITAYRHVQNRPTIPTIGPTDLTHGLTIEGPFDGIESFSPESGISHMAIGGTRSDGSPFVSAKGFFGGFHKLQPTHDVSVFDLLQEYASGRRRVSAARRVLHEAYREIRHGDFGLAAVLGGSALEIGIIGLLDRQSLTPGRDGSFATKHFIAPFTATGKKGFDQLDAAAYGLVERLYRVRNKVIHEGEAYYFDDTAPGGRKISATAEDVQAMLDAASAAMDWIEGYA